MVSDERLEGKYNTDDEEDIKTTSYNAKCTYYMFAMSSIVFETSCMFLNSFFLFSNKDREVGRV